LTANVLPKTFKKFAADRKGVVRSILDFNCAKEEEENGSGLNYNGYGKRSGKPKVTDLSG
jgi:hypothetical protein